MFFKKFKLKSLLKRLKKQHHLRDEGGNVDIKHEIKLLHNVAKFYDDNAYNKKFPHAKTFALEYYRAAANLDDPLAQYICGQRFLEKAKFWDEWLKGEYANAVHKKYAQDLYAEAFAYLKASEQGGYALAKRLHGMAYIHGWGVEKNTQTGFKYVLDSIEMENAWDRATKILEELKLSSPEFFNTLMQYKSEKGR